MNDNNTVFDDIMEGLREIPEYQKGNIELRTHTVTIEDEDLEANQIIYKKIADLPSSKKQIAIQYLDELAVSG